MVLHDHDDELDALGDRRDDLLGHHQVRAVADQGVHLPLGGGHLDPERAGDLVAHAGERVLHVVLLRVLRPPQHLQVAGHGAGRLHDRRVRTDHLVERAQHLGLRGQRLMVEVVGLVDDAVPPLQVLGVGADIRLVDAVAGQRQRPGAPRSRPGRRRRSITPACLAASSAGDVEVDEPHARVLERRPGRRGEVAVAGADADHDVGLAGQRVRHRRAGRPDPADGLRVVPPDRALAGLGVGDRDAGRLGEPAQLLGRLAVDHAATGDEQRPARGPEHRDGAGQRRRLRHRPADVPDPLGEQLLGPVVGLGLHVLRQRDGDRAGLGRVGQHPHRAHAARRAAARGATPGRRTATAAGTRR